MEKQHLEFVPFMSSVNPSFWNKLSEIKLNIDKLDENVHEIWGYFTNLNTGTNFPAIAEVDSTSFNRELNATNIYLPMWGKILNLNTIDAFKDFNKTVLIKEEGNCLWNCIKSGKAMENPAILNSFFILSFADLKKYHYYYWFVFPAPCKILVQKESVTKISHVFSEVELVDLYMKYEQLGISEKPFFVICKGESGVSLNTIGPSLTTSETQGELYFTFSDPSTSPSYPGWPLRNYILFILHHFKHLEGQPVKFIAFRLSRLNSKIACSSSLVFSTVMPDCNGNIENLLISNPETSWTGWEKNERGKLGPRMSNMKNSLDPKCLAESAVDLNLKLIKWRLLPDINLDKIKSSKCLLLGAGTLGCSVARTLLAWGVGHITFVDNSIVSFSNPVRQSLYTYEDSVKSSPKAEAAAENLKKIYPGVITKGYNLNIPMPGHPVGTSLLEQVEKDVKELTDIINAHDVIFLLLDSRESRWLPTLLGNYSNKIVINAALGFDSYLIMRHGAKAIGEGLAIQSSSEGFKAIPGEQLGCYFCSDVTAPGNSLRDRSLDQQCTVTRPGVSAIAGAFAVELAISLLQHDQGVRAPAYYKSSGDTQTSMDLPSDCVLGILPHSIRGFLSSYSHIIPAVERYIQCIACSNAVLQEYANNGFDFLLKVFNSSVYLEEVTGLDKLQADIDQEEIWELSD